MADIISTLLKYGVITVNTDLIALTSGAIKIANGVIQVLDDVLAGNIAETLSDLTITYNNLENMLLEQSLVTTIVNPISAPITSNSSTPVYARADNSKVVEIANTQPNDIHITPIGIEPPLAYRGVYPYVATHKSESGHINEIDDTPGNERLFRYHRAGSYEEYRPDGDKVNKINGDHYTIIAKDGKIYIEGQANLYVKGNIIINCMNDSTINVAGKTEMNVGEDFRLKAKNIYLEADLISQKSLNSKITSDNIDLYAKQSIKITGKTLDEYFESITTSSVGDINIGSQGAYVVSSKGKASIKSDGNISLDAAQYDIDSGSSVSAKESIPAAKTTGTGLGSSLAKENGPSVIESIIQGVDDDSDSINTNLDAALAAGRISQEEYDEIKNKTYSSSEIDSDRSPSMNPRSVSTSGIEKLPDTAISGELQMSKYYRLCHLTHPSPIFPYQIRAQGGRNKSRLAANLSLLSQNCLDPIKEKYSQVSINSAFRQGSGKSQHERGMAADLTFGRSSTDPESMYQIATWVRDNILFDQLILEYGNSQIWIHISYNGEGSNRQQILTCKNPANPVYDSGLHKVLEWKPK